MTAGSRRRYRAALGELLRALPDGRLQDFEPPDGTVVVSELLQERWGHRAPRTYNKSVSIFREFFAWQTNRGNLRADPAGLMIERKPVDRESRTAFTESEQ